MEHILTNTNSGASIVLHRRKIGAYNIQELDLGQVEGIQNTTRYINLLGEHVHNTGYGPRDVSVVGIIKAGSAVDMAERKAVLNRLVNPKDPLTFTYGDYQLTMRPDRSVLYATDYQDNNNLFCKFMIQATAHMPFFMLRNPYIITESSITGNPMFALFFPAGKGRTFGVIPTSSARNPYNGGDVECGFIVRFRAANGPAQRPKLINHRSDTHIEINIDLEQGDTVEVSTVSGDKYAKFIRGGQETDIFKAISSDSTMSMTLLTGDNELSVTAGGQASNLTTSITYAPLFMEVQ